MVDYDDEDIKVPREICGAEGPDKLLCERFLSDEKLSEIKEHAAYDYKTETLVKW